MRSVALIPFYFFKCSEIKMQAVKFVIGFFCFVFCCSTQASPQPAINASDTISGISADEAKRRINFYVADKLKIYELFNRLVIWRARLHGMSRRDRLIIVLVRSSEEAKNKIIDYLRKKHGLIGSLWFDSHGYYANGYSSFTLGKDQFSYKTINDTVYTQFLRALIPYCNDQTNIAIGSCYGGATFEKPSNRDNPPGRMNGDSLMIGLGNIFPCASIYGTESWVMTKPGIFMKNSFALAGFPLGRRFKTEAYRPVWERMGVWHCYTSLSEKMENINTVCLSRAGSIYINPRSYLDVKANRNKLHRILNKIDKRTKKHARNQEPNGSHTPL